MTKITYNSKTKKYELIEPTRASRIMSGITTGLAAIVLAALGGMCVKSVLNDAAHERAWRAARLLANKKEDNNNIFSAAEYASIYRALGLKDTGQYAWDLSTGQLKEYIFKESKAN